VRVNGHRLSRTDLERHWRLAALGALCSCDARERVPQPAPATQAGAKPQPGKEAMSLKLQIKIGQKTFTATLEDSPATAKFRQMLPLTLDMPDLNANEKHVRLPERLPTKVTKPGTIRAGDLLLWGDDTLVLFYETFRSSYSYTRLGRLDDPTGLAEAVGSGSVTVTFEAVPADLHRSVGPVALPELGSYSSASYPPQPSPFAKGAVFRESCKYLGDSSYRSFPTPS
jgi:hypothetical protein